MGDQQPQIQQDVDAKFRYILRRIEFLNRDADGWQVNGPSFRFITQPMQNAWHDFQKMSEKIKKRYKAALSTFAKRVGMPYEEWMNQSVEVPDRPGFITRRHAWAVYCSLFNEANIRAIRASEGNNYTDDQLEYIRSIITQPEKALFQEMADHFASFIDRARQIMYKLSGNYPKEVDDVYWPIKVESRISGENEAPLSKSAVANLFRSAFDSAYVPFRSIRIDTARKAVTVDDSWILPRLIEQARCVAFALTIRDTQKLITHPEYVQAVKTTKGEAWYSLYMGYLQDFAYPNAESSNEPVEVQQALGVLDEAEQQLIGEGPFDRDAFDLLKSKIEGELHLKPLALGKLLAEVGGTPREWIYAQMGNIAGDYLESGQFHIYRGVLNTHGPGPALLRIFDSSYDELVRIGHIDADYAEEQKRALRVNIEAVG